MRNSHNHWTPTRGPNQLHRDGRTARIEVTNGARELAYEVPLDIGEMPAAVTVDIAAVFPEGSTVR